MKIMRSEEELIFHGKNKILWILQFDINIFYFHFYSSDDTHTLKVRGVLINCFFKKLLARTSLLINWRRKN